MPNVNTCSLGGHLTREPELRQTTNSQVCKMGLAVNSGFGDFKGVAFTEVEVWGRPGDWLSKADKGDFFYGDMLELCMDEWDDRQTGAKRSKLYFKARPQSTVFTVPKGSWRKKEHEEVPPPATTEPLPNDSSGQEDNIPF